MGSRSLRRSPGHALLLKFHHLPKMENRTEGEREICLFLILFAERRKDLLYQQPKSSCRSSAYWTCPIQYMGLDQYNAFQNRIPILDCTSTIIYCSSSRRSASDGWQQQLQTFSWVKKQTEEKVNFQICPSVELQRDWGMPHSSSLTLKLMANFCTAAEITVFVLPTTILK